MVVRGGYDVCHSDPASQVTRRRHEIIYGTLICLPLIFCAAIAQAQSPSKSAIALPTELKATPQRVRLITQEQYVNSLTYIFGPDLHLDARFPPMRRTEGLLANGAAVAGVTNEQLEEYQRTAASVAGQVVSPAYRDYLIPCKPANPKASDVACATKFLSGIGRLLYRQPLPKEKLAGFVAEASAGADKVQDFYAGLSATLEGMLLSPNVLFVTDHYQKNPKGSGSDRLDAYSLAQRLSFFLWNAAPDDALIKAAENGEIQTPKGLKRVVDRMLESPRLEVGMRAFFDDMMGFDDFSLLSKDGAIYPSFTAVTATDAREQTLRTIINFLVVENKDYRDLYTTRETFMSQPLGAIYGVPALPGWRPYTFPDGSGRAGLTAQISFLALHAHPGRSSPTLRGKAIREILLCQAVPPPPGNVDFSKVENPDPSLKTMRQRLTAHRSNPVCAGCHRLTDPLGLTLEQFDGAGIHRTTENGSVIDVSGTMNGKDLEGATGLGEALHDNPALTSCLVRRIYSYGTGGTVGRDDEPMLTYLNQRFAGEGYRLLDLLRTITLSPAFSEGVPPAPAPVQTTASVQQNPGQHSN